MKHIYLFSFIACTLLLASCEIKKVSPAGDIAGYEYVDLGLSVYWATTNVGAQKPEIVGDRFQWGETECSRIASADYEFLDENNKLTKYCTEPENGKVDNLTQLEPQDDAANVYMGNEWRTPTHSEWVELFKRCCLTNVTLNGIPGVKVTGPNGKYIFLPAPQKIRLFYMSSTLDQDMAANMSAKCFYVRSTTLEKTNPQWWTNLRTSDFIIRPVHNK